MSRELPATLGAQLAILIRKSVRFSNRNMTKVLPATAGAQITILLSKRADVSIRN